MKTNLIFTIAAIVGFLLFHSQLNAQNIQEIRLERNKFDKPSLNSPISATLIINPLQSRSAKGLKFTLKLTNNSNAAVTIYNPLDAVKIILIDEDGGDLIVPHWPRFMAMYSGPFNTKFESFSIEKVVANGKVNTTDFTKTENFTLPANAVCEFELAINNVLRDSPKPTSTINKKGDELTITRPQVKQNAPKSMLQKGKYKMQVSASFYQEPATKSSFRYSVVTPDINVKYGL